MANGKDTAAEKTNPSAATAQPAPPVAPAAVTSPVSAAQESASQAGAFATGVQQASEQRQGGVEQVRVVCAMAEEHGLNCCSLFIHICTK